MSQFSDDDDLDDEDDEDWDDGEDLDEDDKADAERVATHDAGSDPVLHQYLVALSKDELVSFVEGLAAQDASVQRALTAVVQNARGPVDDLIREARSTIDRVSGDAVYSGSLPSASTLGRLHARLTTIVRRGRADDVLALCQRLLRRANQAVEQMHETDDEFAESIEQVLTVIPEALRHSSKGQVEQLLWLHELQSDESYGLLPDMHEYWEAERPVEVWDALAARIEQRLAASTPAPTAATVSPSLHHDRDAWSRLLATALERAGRADEIVQLYEREAETTGSYQRLVTYLLDRGDLDRAEHWIDRGVAATPANRYGLIERLRVSLRTIRELRGDAAGVAALDAYEFIIRPGPRSFEAALASAEAAGHRALVRQHLFAYLETLVLPWQRADADDAGVASASPRDDTLQQDGAVVALAPWPLPRTALPDPPRSPHDRPPLARVLLDIALSEGRLDDVLHWYDFARERASGGILYGYNDPSMAVARAVEESHPDRAIGIWEDLASRAVARTNTSAYEEAAGYLEHSARIEARHGNLDSWRERVQEVRARERRKWRLRETLDRLLARFPAT